MLALRRHALMACGFLALGLAVAGVALPLLPTVPFLLLAAACFLRSSHRMHAWLLEHPRFGNALRDYYAGAGIDARTRVIALITLWASVLASAVFFIPLWFVDAALVVVAVAVSVYLLRLPSR